MESELYTIQSEIDKLEALKRSLLGHDAEVDQFVTFFTETCRKYEKPVTSEDYRHTAQDFYAYVKGIIPHDTLKYCIALTRIILPPRAI